MSLATLTRTQAGSTGIIERIGVGHIVLAAALLVYPAVATEFFILQIGAYSLIWGLIALSLMLLGGYGGCEAPKARPTRST